MAPTAVTPEKGGNPFSGEGMPSRIPRHEGRFASVDDSVLSTVYWCCMGAGLLFPLLQLVLDFLNLDFGSGDFPLPFSFTALSFGVLVLGAVGQIVLVLGGHWLLSLGLGLLLGVLAFLALTYYVIRPLKQSAPPPVQSIGDLRWKEGVIKLAPRKDFTGTVRVLGASGSYVTYSARPASWVEEEIPVGTRVLIVEVDEEANICTVCPFESYRKELERQKQKGGF